MSRFPAASLALLLAATACGESTNILDPALPPVLRSLRVLGCDSGLRLDFSNDLDPSTVTAQTVFVEGATGAVTYDPAGRSVVLLPSEPFASGSTLTAVVTSELATTSGARLPDSLRWSFVCIDRTPPLVVGREPAGEGASPLTQVRVRFSEPMDVATLTSDTLRVQGVTSAVAWDAATRTATLTPQKALYPGRAYVVTVDARVRDLAGNLLGADTSWSFRTRVPRDDWAVRLVTPPVPAAAACDAPIRLRLAASFAVDEAALAGEPVRIDGAPGAKTSWDPELRLLELAPLVPLRPGERYTLVATEALRDTAGDRPFDAAATIATLDVVASCDTPTVSRVEDAWGATACEAGPTIEFSQPMDAETLEGAIRLQNLTAGGYDLETSPDVEVSVTLDESGRVAQVTPTTPLTDGELYWLSVTVDAKTSNGTPLAAGSAWEMGARCP